MTAKEKLTYNTVELEGTRYAIVPESLLLQLLELKEDDSSFIADPIEAQVKQVEHEVDQRELRNLTIRLCQRRQYAGLSQEQLASQAGIRPEDLDEIEHGHGVPNYLTLRKLAIALRRAEATALEEAG